MTRLSQALWLHRGRGEERGGAQEVFAVPFIPTRSLGIMPLHLRKLSSVPKVALVQLLDPAPCCVHPTQQGREKSLDGSIHETGTETCSWCVMQPS